MWLRSLSNEWGCLAQGNDNGVKGTDTIQFIHKHQVLDDNQVTYASYVFNYQPLKDKQCRVRITVGGDRLDYKHDAGSLVANLLETKILLNSVMSNDHGGTRFMSADMKDHFLATLMDKPERMKVDFKCVPEDIRFRCKLDKKKSLKMNGSAQ